MTIKQPHPVLYPQLVALGQDRSASLLGLQKARNEVALHAEFRPLEGDSLGFDGRMDYAATVSHIWESFVSRGGKMHAMADKLPDIDGLREIAISELSGLRLPDAFYAHYGEEVGLALAGHPNIYVDGVYFVHTTVLGDPMYLYMVACGNRRAAFENMSLGQLTIEKTRVAIGTVEPTQQFSDTFDDLIGDPEVCDAVRQTALKDVIALSLAFISDPDAALDLRKEVHLSPPTAVMGMRN
ncbi:hypothetical protein [Rhizobium bangladeshense]|uniref:hypothetical protein n=1 Tax=Rhizobium bangladeshense TaxID=1138189 RepID=UPI0007E574B2|nr:hypothetical protein [Rhizobium bangladeshense]